jgi:hypothetical protein
LSIFNDKAAHYFYLLDQSEWRSGYSGVNTLAQLAMKVDERDFEPSNSRHKILSYGMPKDYKAMNMAYLSLRQDDIELATYARLGHGVVYEKGKVMSKRKMAQSLQISVGAFDTKVSRATREWQKRTARISSRQKDLNMR